MNFKKLIRNLALSLASAGLLIACGGTDSQSPTSNNQSQLLADGEPCNAPWSSTQQYNGGNAASYGNRNYTAAYWTQGNNPSTSSGPAGSGQPWTTGSICVGGGTTTTAAGTTTTAGVTTTTSGSCNYANWAAGTNYALGTIVKYAANGNFYKVINTGANGSDGTDPTISTWYWSQTTCSGGVTTTAATTTTTAASCSYPNWATGTNYALGTIVKYPANGNFYKVVNSGANGSDGTDPTISTWYWSQHTCSGGTTTTVGGTTTTTGSPGSFVVSEAQFNTWFPNRNPFYTYADLLAAISYYPTFAKSGNATLDKQEAAAFFANLQHESDHLKAVREYNTANYPLYCDVNWVRVTCDSNDWNDQYFGRGPIQISWTSNYRNLSNAMGLGNQLVDNPELLATNATIAWRSALWFWMTQTGAGTMTPHNAIVGGAFGQTIKSINGNRECVGGTEYQGPAQMQVRVNYYTTFTQNLGVPTGSNLTC